MKGHGCLKYILHLHSLGFCGLFFLVPSPLGQAKMVKDTEARVILQMFPNHVAVGFTPELMGHVGSRFRKT